MLDSLLIDSMLIMDPAKRPDIDKVGLVKGIWCGHYTQRYMLARRRSSN